MVSKAGQCLNLRPRYFLIYSIIKKNQKWGWEIKTDVLSSLKSLVSGTEYSVFFRLRSEYNQT